MKARDADSPATILFLPDREAHGHGISCRNPALWARRPAVAIMSGVLRCHDSILANRQGWHLNVNRP